MREYNIRSVAEKVQEKLVRRESGCLEWTGYRRSNGYGVVTHRRQLFAVHRWTWEQVHGPIPEGLMVDHLCHNRACCEVRHLRLATNAQNQHNRKGANVNSSTGALNVYPSPKGFAVRVTAHGVRHFGGLFKTLEAASQAAAELRAKLHDPIPLDMTEG